MKKSLIAIAILCATLSIASAGSASIAPATSSISKPASVHEETGSPMQKTGLYCIDNDQCRLRNKTYLSTEQKDVHPTLHSGDSGWPQGWQAIASVVGPQTGGFVGGIYIPRAGAIPEGNRWVAT